MAAAVRCGALPAIGAASCLLIATRLQDEWQALVPARLRSSAGFDAFWIQQLGVILAIAAIGLAAASALRACRIPAAFAARAGLTLVAVCCLAYGIRPDGTVFGLFQPPGATFLISMNAGHLDGQVWSLVLGDLMLVGGAVALTVGNIDIITAALRRTAAPFSGAAPSVRVATAYLLDGRFKALANVSVTALVTFLTTLILTINGSIAASSLDATATAGFQLAAGPEPGSSAAPSATSYLQGLHGTVTSAATLTIASGDAVKTMTANLPGRAPQALTDQLTAVDAAFARDNQLNLSAIAAGYPDARTVWNAIEHRSASRQPAPSVWRFEPGIAGVAPDRSGFAPFTVSVTSADGHIRNFLVIAIAAATSHWPALFTGPQGFREIAPHAQDTQTLLHLAPGANPTAAVTTLAERLGPHRLQVQSLVSGQAAGAASTTAVLLTGYLALGLLFGALALGVVTSRSVLERRAHLGVLRAVGLSTKGLLLALLTETGLQVALSLTLGIGMALWSAHRILAALSPIDSTPWAAITAICAGCLALTAAAVALPLRRAAATSPAQATRTL
jgi:hypothetical protein